MEQGSDDDDRQAWFWRHRPKGFAVNEKEHVIYVLEFNRNLIQCRTPVRQTYVVETQRVVVELQHLTVTDTTSDLKHLFEDTQWTVEQPSFVDKTITRRFSFKRSDY